LIYCYLKKTPQKNTILCFELGELKKGFIDKKTPFSKENRGLKQNYKSLKEID